MQRQLIICIVCLVSLLSSVAAYANNSITAPFSYRGVAVDGSGIGVSGRHDLQLRYLSTENGEELLSESFPGVSFEAGRFLVDLGTGSSHAGSQFQSLRQVFAGHPEILMEISIDGVVQNPWVRILPAGHSPAALAAMAGPVGAGDEKLRWKGYEVESSLTAVQAVILGPADANGAGPVPIDSTYFTNPYEGEGYFLGESEPLRDMPTIDPTVLAEVEAIEVNRPRHEDLYDEQGRRYGTTTDPIRDPLANLGSPEGSVTPPLDVSFAGIGNINGVLPPDTEGTVGPNHYIQVVNLSFAIYDKTGALLVGPFNTNTLFAGAGGACQNDNSGDAIFLYDELADRFVLTQFAVSSGQAVCFAVSTTPDPTGTYFRYQFNTLRFPDYYKLGVWPDPNNNAYFMGTNSGFQSQYDVYAMDRANMLVGAPATFQAFQNHVNLMMPADVDGVAAPVAAEGGSGGPGIFYTFRDGGEPYFGSPPTDSLDIWEFDVDWAVPANSTFALVQSFVPPTFAAFNWSVCGFFVQQCLPQPGTAQRLDSGSWWPMQRLQYRNMGTHESLVGSFTVDVTGSPDHGGIRWFELRRPIVNGSTPAGAGWSIHQQGTWAPDADHRFFPSAAMDGDGNIAVGYSVTSATTFPSARYSVHAASDPPGTLRPEASLVAGTGSQTHPAARWGDYSSMEVDPADDCTFWYTNEYIETTGSAPWKTWVGSFQVPGCGGMSAIPASQSICAPDTAQYAITLLDRFAGTTIMNVTGCPAGGSCSFDPNPVVFPDTTTDFEVFNSAGITPGDYAMNISAVDAGDPSINAEIGLALAVFDTTATAPTLDSPANGATDVPLQPTLEWSGAVQAQSYDIEVATDPGFTDIVFSSFGNTNDTVTVSPALESSTTHHWRVRASNPCGTSGWVTASFTTVPLPGDCSLGQDPLILFEDDLEGDVSGYVSSGTGNTWTTSSARTHSGSVAFHATNVATVSDQYLVTPAIDLSGAVSTTTLSFWNHQTIEDRSAGCYDGAVIEVSTNGGTTWTRLEAELLTDPYDGPISTCCSNPIAPDNAWCGDPQDWTESIIDIGAFVASVPEGANVQFRFRLATDSTVAREGWYIDDLAIQTCVEESDIFSDDFESGTTDAWSSVFP